MKNFDIKKCGFTLMEISVTLLVIGILILLSIPIIKKQSQKADEYSYYLAYKTVEKLGSQIVSYGDPALEASLKQNNKFALLKSNISLNISYLANYLTPKSYADSPELLSWTEYQYYMARICLMDEESQIPKSYDGYSFTYWQRSDIANYCNSFNETDFYRMFVNDTICNVTQANLITELKNQTNPKTFCETYLYGICGNKNNISISVPKYVYAQSNYNDSYQYHECIIYQKPAKVSSTSETIEHNALSAIEPSCEQKGYTNASGEKCGCNPGYSFARNNNNVCCPGTNYYAKFSNGAYSCVTDLNNDYDEAHSRFCPDNSQYSSSDKRCVCNEGFVPQGDPAKPDSCVVDQCQKGSKYDVSSKTCVLNSPITKAKRFCELISEYWNVSDSSCDTFTNHDGISYYDAVFNASTTENQYLSIKATKNAFKNVTPNIIFANGQRLWILGDKTASIAGLSYDPTQYSPEINVCKDTGAHTANTCTGDNSYFCRNENRCFTINSGNRTVKLEDARNCCRSLDVTDIESLYPERGYRRDPRDYAINGFTVFVDINGGKDDKDKYGYTLWHDVFPFYVSANGHVYPAYPLNASKANSSDSSSKDSLSLYIGGNSTSLSTDVYYYDMTENGRKRVVAYPSIPFARAVCFAKNISAYTPYCQNLGTSFKEGAQYSSQGIDKFINSENNICDVHRCFIHVKNKFKLF